MAQETIIVLGMHRSGTSCLTGSLQNAGLELGQHSTSNPHNIKGNRENGAIMMLNDAILEENGGAWNEPPKAVRWTDQHKSRANKIISENGGSGPWGFKDPRSLLTIEGWLELLPDTKLIGIFRNPNAVAGSLLTRGTGVKDHAEAVKLWQSYNCRLLALRRRFSFPLLNFDWDEERFHRNLFLACGTLGLDSSPQSDRFYEQGLIHEHQETPGLPLSVRYTYWRLQRAARETERQLQ